MAPNTGTDPAGISNFGLSFLSMIVAWLMKKVENCENEIESAIVVAHIGTTLTNDLNSSTCVTETSLQRFFTSPSGPVITAALSRKLQVNRKK